MVYDAFAHLPIYGLEDLGFVGRGEAGAFIEEGNTSPGGRLPMNTNGGGLSYTHTGMYGMFAAPRIRCARSGAKRPRRSPTSRSASHRASACCSCRPAPWILGTAAAAG